jgi:hypothetical protein
VTPTSVSDSAFRFPAVHRLGNKGQIFQKEDD